jgi:membrane protease YdiL (CAAX protease family)
MSEIVGFPKDADNGKKQPVTDDRLSWRHQDKSYNECYKIWRKQKKDTIGFYYVDSPNELTYQDGVGFIKNYPEAVETNALSQLNHYIGISLLIVVIIDILGKYAVPVILNKLGADITLDIADLSLYGNPWIIIALAVGSTLLKAIYPVFTCLKVMQVPVNLLYPVKITNKPMFRISVPITLMFCGLSVMAIYFLNMLQIYLHIDTISKINFVIDDNNPAKIVYLIVIVVISPVLSELGGRCLLTQLLRQFGDGYAIIVTSIFSALVTYSLTSMVFSFIMSLIMCYFMMRTGSVITSIIMKISIFSFSVCFWLIKDMPDSQIKRILMISFLLLCIIPGLIAIIWFIIHHSDKIGMPIMSRYLSFSDKIIIGMTSKSIIFSFALIFIITLFNIRFKN